MADIGEDAEAAESAPNGVPGFSADEVAAIAAVVAPFPIATVVHSVDWLIIATNGECRELLGYETDDLVGASVVDFIPDAGRGSAARLAAQIVEPSADRGETSAPVRALRQLHRKDGTVVSCWMHIGAGVMAGRRVFIVCMDLVNPVVHDAHMWRSRAERDDLTGLYRRAAFLERVDAWVAADKIFTLAFIDVDNLKVINDTRGHSAGDALLEAVASRLMSWLPVAGVAARFAGDEFVLALTDRLDPSEVDDVVIELRGQLCDEPVAWSGELLSLSVSIGVVTRLEGEGGAALIARADERMYFAKTHRG